MYRAALLSLLLFLPAFALADPPEIVGATAKKSGMGWRISVTLKHPDTGWDHYADGWELQDMAGNVLGFRKLAHPHGHNEPFTRSLSSVMIPDGTRKVKIRARCNTGDWSEFHKLKLR
ncbi:hypothetical protein OB2597_12131 [Pseudooceanicola batsensis HTCC2597]|uniref:Uncharacterized protein n=1 Tax=Pseudooceanicola batsensis (strain ATCC BAA-863 / DSM 15984 / KCTC 12145 / HTCC2597) TaxID=252305 RepID=A3TWJ6_PSEBH|nr:hypothetical protein [Pseudooceanicola batsensis]EAQ03992.1 hypothetical protein OB2597_12131 [Pseudooceanicola batsensis HTCC2597]